MKVVILTASTMKKTIQGREYSGKCITAFDLAQNRVLRFVQNKEGAPIEPPYCDNYQPLEIHDIVINEYCPLKCQTENVLADYKHFNYLKKYDGSIQDIYERFQSIEYGDSSFMLDGLNKLMDISPYFHSLELIQVSDLTIRCDNGSVKCSFIYMDRSFENMSVTDPLYSKYRLPNGFEKELYSAILAVSIPTEGIGDKGYYKFVASVFPTEKPWSKEEDEDLIFEYRKGWQPKLICDVHKRTEKEIQKRLSFLLKDNRSV